MRRPSPPGEPRWDRRNPEHWLVRWALMQLSDLFALTAIGGWPTDDERRAIHAAWPENCGRSAYDEVRAAREAGQASLF